MGYPMTYRRVIGRNHLAEGDYNTDPYRYISHINLNEKDDGHPEIGKVRREECIRLYRQLRLICGDLRRLERDTVDEASICQHIADRTGVDADTVAIVLKEFLNY